MAKLSFQLDGQAEVARRVQAYGAEVSRRVAQVVAEFALKIEADAKQRAPVGLTGALRANIRADISRVLTDLAAPIVAGVHYAPYVEFGTGSKVEVPPGAEGEAMKHYVNGEGRTPAQPFLFPALEAHRSAFVRAIREVTR